MHDRELFIDGGWQPPAGRIQHITDPATGEAVGAPTAIADANDIDEAVVAAERALPLWAGTHADERARILYRAADLIVEARIDAVADLLTREQGKPIPDAIKEIRFGVDVIRYYAEEGRRIGGSIRASVRSDVRNLVVTAPVGVVGAITPWNYPVDIYAWKVGPALAAGCTMVVKPAAGDAARHCSRRTMFRRRRLTGRGAERPSGVRPGGRRHLAAHSDVRMITATASTAAGKSIMRAASDTLKRLSLELGGQCPFVVLDDANVEEAAAAAARRSFSNMGQICIAVNRIIVVESLHDAFIEALSEQTRKMKLGHGIQSGVAYGPVLNENVRSRTRRHIEDALAHGGRLVVGGSQPAGEAFDRGFFFNPTVIEGADDSALVMTRNPTARSPPFEKLATTGKLSKSPTRCPMASLRTSIVRTLRERGPLRRSSKAARLVSTSMIRASSKRLSAVGSFQAWDANSASKALWRSASQSTSASDCGAANRLERPTTGRRKRQSCPFDRAAKAINEPRRRSGKRRRQIGVGLGHRR